MTKIIKYITGVPLDKEPTSKRFDDVKKEYGLKEENVDVWAYRGPLTLEDFKALNGVLTSDEYFDLLDDVPNSKKFEKSISSENKNKLLDIVKRAKLGNLQLTRSYRKRELESLLKTSENFLPLLEEILTHKDSQRCYNDAHSYILKQSEEKGEQIPISFSYPYLKSNLSYNEKVLVFIDEKLSGEVTLEKTKEYHDEFAGHTEEGTATIKVGAQQKKVDWTYWQSNALRYTIDPTIRDKILKEKEGIRFTRG